MMMHHQPAAHQCRRLTQSSSGKHGHTAAARPCSSRRPRAAAGPAADAADAAPTSTSERSREDALLLAYYASQNQSLFAAQCFVESVLDAYTRGDNVDSLQTALQLKNMQQGGSLLQPQDESLMLSWIILVMLAAKEVGVAVAVAGSTAQQQQQQQEPPTAGAAGSSSSAADATGGSQAAAAAAAADGISTTFSREVLGLLQFAKQAAKLWFEEGYNVQKLQSLQATVASDPSQGQSQFLVMMQQYTRLVIITLEVAACCKLPTARPLDNDTSLHAPSGYTAAWDTPLPPYASMQQQQSDGSGSGSDPAAAAVGLVTAAALAAGKGGLRAHAVKLMTAFVGAVIGSPYSMRAFVLAALEAYEAGVPAEALHKQLADQEFAQTGGLVPAIPQPEVLIEVNRTLFGRWLSLVYMAAAQMNAVFPGAGQHSGWAWYGGEDEVQANAMAGFVAQTLLRLQEEQDAAAAAGQEQQDMDVAAAPQDPLVQRLKSTPESAAQLEAASRELQEELREQGTLRGKAVPTMVKVPDANLEATSGAVRVWRQQVELVQAVYQYMRALQAMVV